MHRRERVASVAVLFLLVLALLPGCADDGAAPTPQPESAALEPIDEDPALVEIFAIVRDYRTRLLAAGLDGDDLRRLAAADDPRATSRRMGLTDEDMAARDARFRAAIDDLVARNPEAGLADGGCDACAEEGVEGLAQWLDDEPTFASARILFLCNIVPLVEDIVSCAQDNDFGTDAMYACAHLAICRHCSYC